MSVTITMFAARCGAATVRCGRASASDQRGQREQQQERRQVAAPAGPRGGQAGDERGVRPRRGLALPAPLQRPVGQQRERDRMNPASRIGSAKLMAAPPRIRLRTAARGGRAGAQRGLAAAQVAGEDRAASRRRWRARRGRRRRGAARARTSSRSAAAAAAKRSRTRRLRVSTWTWRPVSGSTSQRSPAGTSCCSRGSTISTAITPWRARSACSGAFPVALAAEVGDDHDEPALAARAPRSCSARRPATSRPRLRPRPRGAARRAARAGPGGPGAGA